MSAFHLEATNGGWFKSYTLRLSTVDLCNHVRTKRAEFLQRLGYRYESCLFVSGGDSEVVGKYKTMTDAVRGHARLMKEYGLK